MSRYILFLAKLMGKGRPLSKGARRGAILWDYPQEHPVVIRDEKVSSFVKFKIILSLLCSLLDPLTNEHGKTWSSMINLWIDSRTYQKLRIPLLARQRSSNYLELSSENVFGEYDAVTLTRLYLKVLHGMISQNS